MKKNLLKELKFYASSLNILVVEDDHDLRESLQELLETLFREVHIAKDGLDALKKFKENRYDIVLTDINMPLMNGVDLSRELRILNKDQCILVLSAYIDDFVIDLIDIGIQGLIIKPYDIEKFLMVLSKNCENLTIKKEFKRSQFKVINSSSKSTEIKSNPVGIERLVQQKVEYDKVDHALAKLDINAILSWEIIEDDIKDYNAEMGEVIDFIMLNGIDQENLQDLAKVFRKYYSSLSLIDNLDSFAAIFEDLAFYFENLDLLKIDEEKLKHFDIYLYIYDDLINFFDVVFMNKEAENIGYLTDSLKSSVSQMKHSFDNNEIEEEELELF